MFNNFSLRKQPNKNNCCWTSLLPSFHKTCRSEPVERLPCYITLLQQRQKTSQKPDQKWNHPHSLQLRLGEIIPAQPDCEAVQCSCSEEGSRQQNAEVSSSFHHWSGYRLSAHLPLLCFLDIPWIDSYFQLMDLSSIKIVFISMQLEWCFYFFNFEFQRILVGFFLPVETASFFELCSSLNI